MLLDGKKHKSAAEHWAHNNIFSLRHATRHNRRKRQLFQQHQICSECKQDSEWISPVTRAFLAAHKSQIIYADCLLGIAAPPCVTIKRIGVYIRYKKRSNSAVVGIQCVSLAGEKRRKHGIPHPYHHQRGFAGMLSRSCWLSRWIQSCLQIAALQIRSFCKACWWRRGFVRKNSRPSHIFVDANTLAEHNLRGLDYKANVLFWKSVLVFPIAAKKMVTCPLDNSEWWAYLGPIKL